MTSGVHGDGPAMGTDGRTSACPPSWLGPYRLIERLGEGGMGVVYLARNPRGAAVAIKVLRPHIAHDEQARRRLAREVDTLSRVRSPHVAAVLDADVAGERPYVVTQYAPGPSLDEVVSGHGPLREGRLLRLARGLFDALGAIHAVGVVHRDLKPGNVLLVDGDPVVIDFGIAHVADDIRLTSTGLVMGTPGYLSPEVVSGAPVTEATDWWGWAATLAFAASGDPPFGRGPMSVVLDRVQRGRSDLGAVDPRFAPVLEAALSPDAGYRPTAAEVLGALERYASGGAATVGVALVSPNPGVPRGGPHPSLSYDEAVAQAISASGHGRPDATQRLDAVHPTGVLPDGHALLPAEHRTFPAASIRPAPTDVGSVYPPQAGTEPNHHEASGWPYLPHRDPRIGRNARSGTLACAFAAILGVAVVYPYLAIALLIAWSVLARCADRSVTSTVLRRHSRGVRRSDVPVAVASAPWHLVSAALATVLALLLPALLALAALVAAAILLGLVGRGTWTVERSLPVGFGAAVAVQLMWWGPGGASLRRGSRSLARGLVPAGLTTKVLSTTLCVVAAGFALWAWTRHGVLDLRPFPGVHLPISWSLSR